MAKFMILTLPRSRSAWLSWYLSYPPHQVPHDLLVHCSSIAEFETSLGLVDGSVETGAMLGWRLIRARYPELKLVVVMRKVSEVHDSFRRLGVEVQAGELEARAEMLAQLADQPGVEVLPYEALVEPLACRWLFEYCLEDEWPQDWWERARGVNIQIDFSARLRWLASRQAALGAFKLEVEAATRRLLS